MCVLYWDIRTWKRWSKPLNWSSRHWWCCYWMKTDGGFERDSFSVTVCHMSSPSLCWCTLSLSHVVMSPHTVLPPTSNHEPVCLGLLLQCSCSLDSEDLCLCLRLLWRLSHQSAHSHTCCNTATCCWLAALQLPLLSCHPDVCGLEGVRMWRLWVRWTQTAAVSVSVQRLFDLIWMWLLTGETPDR